jgi:hypothetical protein
MIIQPVPQVFFETVISESLKIPARVWRDYLEGVVLAEAAPLGEIKAPTLILWGAGPLPPARRTGKACEGDPRRHLEGVL